MRARPDSLCLLVRLPPTLVHSIAHRLEPNHSVPLTARSRLPHLGFLLLVPDSAVSAAAPPLRPCSVVSEALHKNHTIIPTYLLSHCQASSPSAALRMGGR